MDWREGTGRGTGREGGARAKPGNQLVLSYERSICELQVHRSFTVVTNLRPVVFLSAQRNVQYSIFGSIYFALDQSEACIRGRF